MLGSRTRGIPSLCLPLFPFLGQGKCKAEHVFPLFPNKQPAVKCFSPIDRIYWAYLAINRILVLAAGSAGGCLCEKRPGAAWSWLCKGPATAGHISIAGGASGNRHLRKGKNAGQAENWGKKMLGTALQHLGERRNGRGATNARAEIPLWPVVGPCWSRYPRAAHVCLP